MLDIKSWPPAAKKLKLDEKTRAEHDCGEGKVMIVSHTSEGYRAHCFRCNESGFVKHDRQSLNTLLKRWRNADVLLERTTTSKMVLPSGCSSDLPSAALLWLARAGIGERLRNKYNILWHEPSARTVVPVYCNESGDLLFYQARSVNAEHKPKYLNPITDRAAIRFVSQESDYSGTCVVTEDILSAIRVGETEGVTGVSLLGTSASTSDLLYISKYKRVLLWFDGDAAGIKCTRRTKKALAMLGVEAECVRTELDPKEYTADEIRRLTHES